MHHRRIGDRFPQDDSPVRFFFKTINGDVMTTETKTDVRIVILQRGWVVVGRYSQNGDECLVDGGYVVRYWGTTRGLGEIAENGPTDKTKLDPSPPIRFHPLTVVASIQCAEEKWAKHLR